MLTASNLIRQFVIALGKALVHVNFQPAFCNC